MNVRVTTAITEFMTVLIIGIVAIPIFFPVFQSARTASTRTLCRANLKQLCTSADVYASDFDGTLMPCSTWEVTIGAYMPNREIPQCPSAGSKHSYAMNRAMSGINLGKVDGSAILFFECETDRPNPSGGPELMVTRHGRPYLGLRNADLLGMGQSDAHWGPTP